MLRLISISDPINLQGTAVIQGPQGCIMIADLVWCPEQLLECYYWQSWAVLQGAYHCCLSIPGKVLLLPPDDPRCEVC